jgi:signal peptidase II
MNNKKKYINLFIILLVILVLDQWTKTKVHTTFRWGESITLIENFFALTYVRNMGAAFGFLNNAPAVFRVPFFLIVPLVVLFVILILFVKLKESEKLTAVALSLILSGAIGNLIDRVRYGFVIDFLDFHWKEIYHWPAFNVADSSIVIGVSMMFLLSLTKKETPREC